MAYTILTYRKSRGIRFSRRELREIGISVFVLTVAFAILFSGGMDGLILALRSSRFVFYFLVSLLAVLTAFFLHEMAHKVLAQRYGCWAEFNYSPMGLIFALLTSLVGILFAAPGAVIIGGPLTREENGRISLAGPATNLGIGALFGFFYFLTRPMSLSVLPGLSLGLVFYYLSQINVILGGFNLIPFPPLDGSKILNWNLKAYLLLVLAALALFGALLLL